MRNLKNCQHTDTAGIHVRCINRLKRFTGNSAMAVKWGVFEAKRLAHLEALHSTQNSWNMNPWYAYLAQRFCLCQDHSLMFLPMAMAAVKSEALQRTKNRLVANVLNIVKVYFKYISIETYLMQLFPLATPLCGCINLF